MSEQEEKTSIKENQSEDLSEIYQFQINNYQEQEDGCELDLEEKYFQKLKEQRKRIQELSLLHQSYEERLSKQISFNKTLKEEIERLSSTKVYQVRYNQTVISLQTISQENKILKDQNEDLKQQIYQSSLDKTNLIQKLKLQVSLLKEKQSSKIQNLQQELQNKQQQIDKLMRDFSNKEKDYLEQISDLKIKFGNLQTQKDEAIRNQQRKAQKFQKEIIYRKQQHTQYQIHIDNILRELNRFKEEHFQKGKALAAKESELKSLSQKYKKHMTTCRKQAEEKDKQSQDLKQTLRKYEKEVKESSSESEILKTEIKKVKESIQIEKMRLQSDFTRQRKELQATIIQHTRTIEQLLQIKNSLMAEKLKLQTILKKKTDCENKRIGLLKSQWKEINKLQKVIDKIIE